MQRTWHVTEAERNQVLRDAFRGHLASGQAVALYVFYLLILVIFWLIARWFMLIIGLVFVLICVAVVAMIWRRQIRGALWAAYPVGSTATSTVVNNRLRLVTAVSTTEIQLDQLRKPRVVGTVVTALRPGARLRRDPYPRALLPDEVSSRLS